MAAMPLQMSPAVLFPLVPSGAMPVTIADTTTPTMAKGMSSQFSVPKNGANAASVKRLEMTEVENRPVPLGDRSVMEGFRPDHAK
jgi:hypothetical protein